MGWDEGRNINLKNVLSKQWSFKKWPEEKGKHIMMLIGKYLPRQKEGWEQKLWLSSVFGRLKNQ